MKRRCLGSSSSNSGMKSCHSHNDKDDIEINKNFDNDNTDDNNHPKHRKKYMSTCNYDSSMKNNTSSNCIIDSFDSACHEWSTFSNCNRLARSSSMKSASSLHSIAR